MNDLALDVFLVNNFLPGRWSYNRGGRSTDPLRLPELGKCRLQTPTIRRDKNTAGCEVRASQAMDAMLLPDD
ncbi:hypothetical protein RRG08_038687 [Elysia crispata]|uniref:Uncharacterized protein n=1 Tax=Elysia crispata TaxID=231223 RepID=A0AAE1DGX9_9GAST|nr:hypothetical protein RRG08_038687 [Elysia crispata]